MQKLIPFPVFLGRHPGYLAKCLNEMTLCTEIQIIADIDIRVIRTAQKLLCLPDPLLFDVAPYGKPCLLTEFLGNRLRTHTGKIRQRVQRNGLVEMDENIVQALPHRSGITRSQPVFFYFTAKSQQHLIHQHRDLPFVLHCVHPERKTVAQGEGLLLGAPRRQLPRG